MKMIMLGGSAIVALFLLSGCATYANGSAPAQNGSIYVVGQKANLAQVWLCPSTPGKGECKEVDVDEVSK